ncbi:TNT antitoxin family protein [Mycobacterium seoulense]|uniref:Immunity factor for TNT n=1 Tax=Mycobacterium seoulense TaxID=386911 RepID=A0A7I7NYJ6_9MYCO|nr:TNT antitoxin family protein [Mycobacterium seoulense]MCV7436298.1 TNT antitoxin family protein [Mycobacterium seoulense]BBY01274.1 immunity factor for TNT [Mycobacterium seoulense]
MAGVVDLSPGLQRWVRLAGLEMLQGTQTNDGRTIIWNTGGEVRYFIGVVDEWYVITSSDRMGPEAFEFAGRTMSVVEKYLYGLFGLSVRGENLPSIRIPFRRDELRAGYSIGVLTFAGRERHTLIDERGVEVAIAGVEDLVELSHYINATEKMVEESYLAADGKPIFGTDDHGV